MRVAPEAIDGAIADDGEADDEEGDEQPGVARADQGPNGERYCVLAPLLYPRLQCRVQTTTI